MKKEIIIISFFIASALWAIIYINDQLKQSDIENKVKKVREIGGHEVNL